MTIAAHRWLMTAPADRSSAPPSTPRPARARWWWRWPAAACATPTSATTTTACAPTSRCRWRSATRSAAAWSPPASGAEELARRAVIVPAVLPCGECDLCRRGLATICRAQKMPGNDIQGGFGSHIVVPARGLCPVDEARLAAAGLTLAQVSIVADALTTPYQAVRRAGVEPGDSQSWSASAASAATACRSRAPSAPGRRDRRRRPQAGRDRADFGAALTLNARNSTPAH
jgi:6-hydroxycyclohex-1-ene-1-carbonyl-CoA dehydrogenase